MFYPSKKYDIKPQRYDFIFSIGEACPSTQALRRAGLQIASYPFDWVCGGSLDERVRLVNEGFKDFFRKEDLEDTHSTNAASKPKDVCEVFKNRRTGISFIHDFYIDKFQSFDEAYDFVNEKYQRRISRLIQKIQQAHKILIVYLEYPKARVPVFEEDLKRAYQQLHSRFPDKEIDVFAMSCERETPFEKRKIERISESVLRVSFDYKALNTAEDENLVRSRLLRQYYQSLFRLKLSFKERCFQWYRKHILHLQNH